MLIQQRAKEWLWRYVPAEIISLITTILPALAIYNATQNMVSTALVATWGGNVGYFGFILLRDIHQTRLDFAARGRRYTYRSMLKNVRAICIEFGVAEILDSLMIRPLLMYMVPQAMGNIFWGLVVAKFLADVSFYIPTILFYEWTKTRWRDF